MTTQISNPSPTLEELTDKHFKDWESEVFGFGYGTGEEYTLLALKQFFMYLDNNDQYDFKEMEKEIGAMAFWLLLNILIHTDIVDYGTSPRYGWLSSKGVILKNYIKDKSAVWLYELVTGEDENHVQCGSDYCNCTTHCRNPLFTHQNQ